MIFDDLETIMHASCDMLIGFTQEMVHVANIYSWFEDNIQVERAKKKRFFYNDLVFKQINTLCNV